MTDAAKRLFQRLERGAYQFPAPECLDGSQLSASQALGHADDLELLTAAGEDQAGLRLTRDEPADLRPGRCQCHDQIVER